MIDARLRMIAAAMLTALTVTPAASAQADYVSPPLTVAQHAPLTGQRANIARDLPHYGYRDVDVRSLSTSQVAQIDHLIHSGRSNNAIRGLIGSTLKRGILQRGLDRLSR